VSGRFLGLDVGGTASRWAVVDAGGGVVARGSAGPATGHLFVAAERTRFEAMMRAVADAVAATAAAPIAGAVLGVTGLGDGTAGAAAAIAATALGLPVGAVAAVDDGDLAYRAVFQPGEGHLVIAGTGSIALHLPAEGPRLVAGGRGVLVDDGGSGAWIALAAIRGLCRRFDDTGGAADAAELAERLAAAVGAPGWEGLRAYVYGGDRGRLGQLAPVVAAAARAGDPLARSVLVAAAAELARLARALVGRAGRRPVAVIGGVLALDPVIAAELGRRLADLELALPSPDMALSGARRAADLDPRAVAPAGQGRSPADAHDDGGATT
jgi:N-acetylglucosamine kinase-like BadF-type ATPase